MTHTVFLPEALSPLIEQLAHHSHEGVYEAFAAGRLPREVALTRVREAQELLDRVRAGCVQEEDAPALYHLLLGHLKCVGAGSLTEEEVAEVEALHLWLMDLWTDLEARGAGA